MTWEETIQHVRTLPEFSNLVVRAYFHEDLELNVTNFGKSEEFLETQKVLQTYKPEAKTILDIGCGNGISAINFALQGYVVTAVEPDPSNTVGAGAIKRLKDIYKLDNVTIHEDFAENIQFKTNTFDVVYVRQAMHHAKDLQKFIAECVRVLKPDGLLLTIRDHVVIDASDKEWFLEKHPLHKYYGGENAFTAADYKKAITNAGALIKKELKYYDSVINYFPMTPLEKDNLQEERTKKQQKKLSKKLGKIGNIPLVWWLYKRTSGYQPLNENHIPGRMYSYISVKK